MRTLFPFCAYRKCGEFVRSGDLQHRVGDRVFHDDPSKFATNCFSNACRDATEELGLQLVGDNVKARIQRQFFA